MIEKFRITIASLPDREHPVAEILYEGAQWAEISQEKDDELIIQLYPHPRQKHWEKPYVNHRLNRKSLDKHGNVMSNKSAESHIPLEEFIYREIEGS